MIKKLGLDYYRNNADVNSGYYEYLLIVDALKGVKNIDDVIILIGGAITDKENEQLSEMLQASKMTKIFIATDLYCLDKCSKIVGLCDYVLGQFHCLPSKYDWLKNYSYNYVPELFFKYNKVVDKIYKDVLFFGGGLNDGRNITLKKYHDECFMQCFVKHGNVDNRLPYDKYYDTAMAYKYHLIIARDLYTKYNWVTSRYVECISMGSVPVVDISYDADNHFKIPGFFRVQTGREAKHLMNYCNMPGNVDFVKSMLYECKRNIKDKQSCLKEIIEEIIEN